MSTMQRVCMLTTDDNPYDPLHEFKEWHSYDVSMGYETTSYLARIARTSLELSEADYNVALEEAIDEIIKFNLTGNYKKICYEVPSLSVATGSEVI